MDWNALIYARELPFRPYTWRWQLSSRLLVLVLLLRPVCCLSVPLLFGRQTGAAARQTVSDRRRRPTNLINSPTILAHLFLCTRGACWSSARAEDCCWRVSSPQPSRQATSKRLGRTGNGQQKWGGNKEEQERHYLLLIYWANASIYYR